MTVGNQTEVSRVLLVEGDDDLHTVLSLLAKHNVPEVFAITKAGGVQRLIESFELLLDLSDRVAIIVDADTNLGNRWREIRTLLLKSGFKTVPEQPRATGTVLSEPGKPVVGIWLMPDNTVAGILENLIQYLVPTGDSLWQWANSTVDAAPTCTQRFGDKDRQKALVHLWLAVQVDPGTPMGLAITKRFLDPDAPMALNLTNWIRQVFVS